ncbi:MAG: 3-deoxy-D-manno-octulosonic acid transferase [Planctomycetota bacterium]|nr:3-deoxy-D-manno-octulosonic acid transferase [Planctomycetota bacterium]
MTTARVSPRVALSHLVYQLLLGLACFLAFLPWCVRSLRDRRQWELFSGRFGRPSGPFPQDRPIWIHAVSVGEVKAARPLVRALEERYPDLPVVISTGTATGQEIAKKTFPEHGVFYAPMDFGWIVWRTLNVIKPRLLILLELEIWPTLMRLTDRAGVPQVILNARMTQLSFESYRRWRWWVPEYDRLDLVAVQDAQYVERFTSLGVPAERVKVTGNLKHDICHLKENNLGDDWADEVGLGDSAPIFVAGSTHQGEDEIVAEAWRDAQGDHPCHLVLVPRHLERLKEIEQALDRLGLPWSRRSERVTDRSPEVVLLVDTMGELEGFFRLASVVFLGGSLVPVGGHNVLEPAAAGKPLLVGPYLETCQREADHLLAHRALEVVTDQKSLTTALKRLYEDETARKTMGDAGLSAVAELTGGVEASLAILEERGLIQ